MRNQDERDRCWRSACNGVLAVTGMQCPICGEDRNAGIDPKDLKAPAKSVWDEIANLDDGHWVARWGRYLTRHYPANYFERGPYAGVDAEDHIVPEWEEVEEYATEEKAMEDLRCDVLSWKKD